MAEPITMTLAGIALTEGVKFLYGQASDILKRWRDRKDKANESPTGETEAIETKLPDSAFEGQLSNPKIHFNKVEHFEDDLEALRDSLAVYLIGDRQIDAADTKLAERVDALRLVLQQIYQQRITFKGENLPPSGNSISGNLIDSDLETGVVKGRVRGVIGTGNIRSRVKTGDVDSTGDVVSVDARSTRKRK
jgi:hypothetical protein